MKTAEEVAEIFKVSTRTVYRWARENKIKTIKVGGTIRFLDEDIEKIKRGE